MKKEEKKIETSVSGGKEPKFVLSASHLTVGAVIILFIVGALLVDSTATMNGVPQRGTAYVAKNSEPISTVQFDYPVDKDEIVRELLNDKFPKAEVEIKSVSVDNELVVTFKVVTDKGYFIVATAEERQVETVINALDLKEPQTTTNDGHTVFTDMQNAETEVAYLLDSLNSK